MKRIYFEWFLSLVILFLGSLFGYDLIVYQLNTDYDFVLEDHQADALHELLVNMSRVQGQEAATAATVQYVKKTHQILNEVNKHDLPQDVAGHFSQQQAESHTFYDADRVLWFSLDGGNQFYRIEPDIHSPIRKAIERDDNMAWLFLLFGFALYCLFIVTYLIRRVRKLENATLDFANGDFSARSSMKPRDRVGTLNKSFNFMADKISNLILSNKALTNAVAHELRTPIFRIQWQAEILAESNLSTKQRHKVQSIVEDTEEMEKMVDELLYYAKVERVDSILNLETIEPNQWVEHLVFQADNRRKLQLYFSGTSKSVTINADPYLLKRALYNLLSNAMKFAHQRVELRLLVEQDTLLFECHDDGHGLSRKHWSRIFDAFYSADAARDKTYTGFGLGLAIVKQIVLRHGGDVSVNDSPLGGACFTIHLPCHLLP
ncbi:HAMP domain-containing protein [Vibrio fluvialis]|nr:HAMP domain-containing protein [Vibrio fluvialis]